MARYQHFGQRSAQLIRFIRSFEAEKGYPPSGDDIADGCGIARAYVYDLLDRMEEEGLIERPRVDGRTLARNLRLTKAAMKVTTETL